MLQEFKICYRLESASDVRDLRYIFSAYGYGLMTMFAKKIKIDHDLPKEAVAFFPGRD